MRTLLFVTLATLLLPASALGQDSGFFAGLDVSGGLAFGSSDTVDGGAAFAGGGVVGNVKFGETAGIGGHVGYQLAPAVSAVISYQHIRGGISWDATFPLLGVASGFSGDAISNVVMANLAYDWALSDRTAIHAHAGLGVSINSLAGVVETDEQTGIFLADVAEHTHINPAAEIGIGISHAITPDAVLGLNAAVSYAGDFRTGNTRSGNLGVTSIAPYTIDDVWRADLGASLRFRF